VPDPSFVWATPQSTLRRFENNFGVFNRQRVFWEKTWQEVDKRAEPEPDAFDDADRFLAMIPPNSFVVDLGCGDGAQAERIAAAGHEVLAVDYSYEALRVGKQTAPPNVTYRFLNLNDRHSVVSFGLDLIEQGRRPYFFSRNVIHEIPPLARGDLFTLLRGVLEKDTFLYATFDANPVLRVPSDPESWHVTVPALRVEAWRWRLGVRTVAHHTRSTPHGTRTNVAAIISL
jgi:SAM-dependent methyltransferase